MSLRTRMTALEQDIAQAKRDHTLLPKWEKELAAVRAQLQHPTIRHGIDFAWGIHPSPVYLHRAGVSFVCRYYSADAAKNLSRTEAEDYSQSGIEIVSIWESTAQASLGGYGAGVADAQAALREAKGVGQPDRSPIFFAVDYEMQAGQAALVDGYLKGACDVLGKSRVGVYGGLATVRMSHERGCANYRWQTLAWSGTPTDWFPHAHLRQTAVNRLVAGVSCDLDVGLAPDFGQWKL